MTEVANTPLESYNVKTTKTSSNELIQEVNLPNVPDVPLAVSIDITWTSGNPTVLTYKDALGVTLKTKTITYTDGVPTNVTWS